MRPSRRRTSRCVLRETERRLDLSLADGTCCSSRATGSGRANIEGAARSRTHHAWRLQSVGRLTIGAQQVGKVIRVECAVKCTVGICAVEGCKVGKVESARVGADRLKRLAPSIAPSSSSMVSRRIGARNEIDLLHANRRPCG